MEMPYPPGFILFDYRWITLKPYPPSGRLYLSGMIDSSYIGTEVIATGKISLESLAGSPQSYKYTILRMMVDSLWIVGPKR